MTDREKLCEMILDCENHYNDILCDGCARMGLDFAADRLADYLIANGVAFVTENYVGGKRGRWIIHSSGRGSQTTNWAECSECRVCGSPSWKVCPVCETKMDLEG